MKMMAKRFSAILTALAVCTSLFIGLNIGTHAAGGSYVKVTEEPADWSGDYLIVYEAGNLAFDGSRTTLDAVSNTQAVTITDNEIEATEAMKAIQFTIEKSGDNYTVKSASGYYIGQTSNANGLKADASTTYNHTIEFTSDSIHLISGGAYLRFNAASNQNRFRYYKSSSYSGQKAIALYKYVEVGDAECEHTNTTENTVPTDENKFGSINEVCDDCGETVNSTPIGATVKYYAFGKEVCVEEGVFKATFPTLSALPDEYADDYIFVGWAKSEVDAATKKPELFTDPNAEINGHTNFYAVYTYSASQVVTYETKDIKDITSTDVVIITTTISSGTVYAMTNSNGTDSSPTAIEVNLENDKIYGEADANLKWNIVASNDSYTIYPDGVTDKWLYCTNTNNGVRVGTNKDNNAFTIDATSGYLKNTATSRYLGVYTAVPDWRCYTSYTTDNIKNQTLGFYVETVSKGSFTYYTSDLAIKGASVDVGTDLTVNFYIAGEYADGTTMTFTMNDKTTTANAQSDTNGTYFAFNGIAPDCMTEEITAELKDGGTVVGALTTTVKDIAKAYIGGDYSVETQAFAKDLLHYGAASQQYTTEATVGDSDLANYGIDSFVAKEFDSKVTDGIGLSSSDITYFRSANVWFANKNSIIVNLQNLPENAKLLVNGNEVAFSGNSYTTEGLMATELGNLYKFTVCDAGGNELQSLTYSVNYYAFVMSSHENAEMAELAKALYNYGVSAVEYKNSLSQ